MSRDSNPNLENFSRNSVSISILRKIASESWPFLLIGYPFIFKLGLNETGLGFAYAISGFSHFISYSILFKCKFNEYKIFNLRFLFIKDGKCILLASKGFWIGLYASMVANLTFALGHTLSNDAFFFNYRNEIQFRSGSYFIGKNSGYCSWGALIGYKCVREGRALPGDGYNH